MRGTDFFFPQCPSALNSKYADCSFLTPHSSLCVLGCMHVWGVCVCVRERVLTNHNKRGYFFLISLGKTCLQN